MGRPNYLCLPFTSSCLFQGFHILPKPRVALHPVRRGDWSMKRFLRAANQQVALRHRYGHAIPAAALPLQRFAPTHMVCPERLHNCHWLARLHTVRCGDFSDNALDRSTRSNAIYTDRTSDNPILPLYLVLQGATTDDQVALRMENFQQTIPLFNQRVARRLTKG